MFHRSDIHQRAILHSARPLLWPSRSGCGWGSNWWLPQGMGVWRQRSCDSRQGQTSTSWPTSWLIGGLSIVYPIIDRADRVSTCFSHVYSQKKGTISSQENGGLSGKVIELNGGFSRPCTGPRWGVGRWVSCWKWVFWSAMFKLQIIGICWLKSSSCSLCPHVYWLYLHQIPSFMFFAACFQLEHSENGAHGGLLQTFHSTFSINPVKFQNSYF